MKSNQEDINRKLADTLSSLDDVKRAKINPFFYTRLKARLGGGKKVSRPWFTSPQLSMAVAAVFLLFCLNFYLFINYSAENGAQTDQVNAFIEAYQIDAGTVYELND